MKCKSCGQVILPSSPLEELRAHLDAVARRTAARAAKGESYYIENSKKWARWLKALDIQIGSTGQLLGELKQESLTEKQTELLRDILREMLDKLETGFLIDMAEVALDVPDVAAELKDVLKQKRT